MLIRWLNVPSWFVGSFHFEIIRVGDVGSFAKQYDTVG